MLYNVSSKKPLQEEAKLQHSKRPRSVLWQRNAALACGGADALIHSPQTVNCQKKIAPHYH